MAQFSDTIHDVKGRSTPMEKIRCLRGIAEMTKLVKGRTSSALPQVSPHHSYWFPVDTLTSLDMCMLAISNEV